MPSDDFCAAFTHTAQHLLNLTSDIDGGDFLEKKQWGPILEIFAGGVEPGKVFDLFEKYLQPFCYEKNQGLFTGYFHPVIECSRKKSALYCYPIYRKPDDLIVIEDLGRFRREFAGIRIAGTRVGGGLIPYYTRQEIEVGALNGQGLEIAWARDYADLFFMHIQGNGTLRFEDGREVVCSYAATNGYPYTAVGSELLRDGHLQKPITMHKIKTFLRGNIPCGQGICQRNQSFVFFVEQPSANPLGRLGVPLVEKVSMAVDPRFIPLGMPLWLDINIEGRSQEMAIAHDVGGAIKGAVRGDYFWGRGEQAGKMAGKMVAHGGYYFFEPKII
jgi:membrane-bound lytic murein transglycosylase A